MTLEFQEYFNNFIIMQNQKYIRASNYSKLIQVGVWEFHVVKDSWWKVLKPNTYFKPNLEQFFK